MMQDDAPHREAPAAARTGARLGRDFPLVCFDWGGTAVEHRGADAGAVRSRIERLTALGVDVAVMSGRDVGSVDGQLRARPTVEGRLFLFLSRGSEVYVVGPGGPGCLSAVRPAATRRRSSRGPPKRCATTWPARAWTRAWCTRA